MTDKNIYTLASEYDALAQIALDAFCAALHEREKHLIARVAELEAFVAAFDVWHGTANDGLFDDLMEARQALEDLARGSVDETADF